MAKRVPKSSKATVALPADYAPLLAEIKARVHSARIRAGLAANRELRTLYWEIGRLILDRQRKEGSPGFPTTFLLRLAASPAIVQAPLARITAAMSPIVQQSAAQLPWMHHCLLLDRLDTPADRPWYAARLVDSVRKALKGAVPSVEELEEGLAHE